MCSIISFIHYFNYFTAVCLLSCVIQHICTSYFFHSFDTMVEAMYEQSPEFFRKLQKTFRFFISDVPPNEFLKSGTPMAFSLHHCNTAHSFCNLETKTPHYHVLADLECEVLKELPVKCYMVPCLYTCYKHLIFMGPGETRIGNVADRLYNAVCYNKTSTLSKDVTNFLAIKKKLPLLCAITKSNSSTQTDLLPRTTIERCIKLMNGRHSVEFFKIMDILESGSGRMSIECCHQRLYFEFDSSKTF